MGNFLEYFGQTGCAIVTSGLLSATVNAYMQKRMLKAQQEFQKALEEKREAFQKEMQKERMNFEWELAKFQANFMRQTQIQIAQENARLRLHEMYIKNTLQTFPLNISPNVLLENQSHPSDYLRRFHDAEQDKQGGTSSPVDLMQVYKDVKHRCLHPDALNVFIAPIHVSTYVQGWKVLSELVWDKIYQNLESFFTLNYNRLGDHPIIFYPTAWNDKQGAGLHTSDTIHHFLKDLPCLVIEPRFDGNVFRMMLSAWNIGYLSNEHEHHRAELSFPISMDGALVTAAYQRSQQALKVIEEVDNALEDANMYGFDPIKDKLRRNVELYEALHVEQRLKEGRFKEVEALGIGNLFGNIFKIDPVQDLAPLADYLSSRIGLNLALLADIHHLRANDANPLLPLLFKDCFPDLYADEELRRQVADEYRRAYYLLEQEEKAYNSFLKGQERDDLKIDMEGIRKAQMLEVDTQLALVSKENIKEIAVTHLRSYAKQQMKMREIENLSFEELINAVYDTMGVKDISFFKAWLHNVDDIKISRKISDKIINLESSSIKLKS